MSTKLKPAQPCGCGKGRASFKDLMCGHCRPIQEADPKASNPPI